jgi:ankyrin repeat protein
VVRLLLEKGADVTAKDNIGWTALHRAARNGHEEVVKLLLAVDGVDLDSKDKGGRTPLWWAELHQHKGVVKLLQSHKSLSLLLTLLLNLLPPTTYYWPCFIYRLVANRRP